MVVNTHSGRGLVNPPLKGIEFGSHHFLVLYSTLHPIWPRDRNGEPCHGYVDDSLPGLPSVTCCMSQQLLEESVIGGANDACHAKGLHTKEWKSREGQRRGNS